MTIIKKIVVRYPKLQYKTVFREWETRYTTKLQHRYNELFEIQHT